MKHRTGHLYQRGNQYWLQYRVEGRVIRQSLKTDDLETAVGKQKTIMRPFMAADLASVHAVIESQLRTAETTVQTALDDAHPPLAVDEAWRAFVKSPNRPDSGPVTLKAYAFQWASFAKWLTQEHKDIKQLRGVTKSIAEEYATNLTGKGITPNTFNKHICVCDLVFRILKAKARIVENPFSEIQRKRLRTQHHRELSTDELKLVCQSATGELRSMLAMGLYLGARLGDAVKMDWGCIDLTKRLIRYTPNKTARRSGKILTVPLHAVLMDIFGETAPAKRTGCVHPTMAALYARRGAYAVTDIVRKHFEKCGITTTREGLGVYKVAVASFHSLRHSAVSLLREAGAPLSVTMAIVGHSTLAMHDTYSHAGEAALKQAVAALPTVIGESKPVVALPPPQADIRPQVQVLAETLNGKTWRAVREKMIALSVAPSAVMAEDKKQALLLPAKV